MRLLICPRRKIKIHDQRHNSNRSKNHSENVGRKGAVLDSLYLFLGIIFTGIIVALLLAPLESLEWWAGRFDARLQALEQGSPTPY